MQKLRLVIDITTSRIIYFTNDVEQSLTCDEHCVLAEHTGPVPDNLLLTNSYNWRYVNKEFVNTIIEQPTISLYDQNKTALIKHVNDNVQIKFDRLNKKNLDLEVNQFLLIELHEQNSLSVNLETYMQLNNLTEIDTVIKFLDDQQLSYKRIIFELYFLKKQTLELISNSSTNNELTNIKLNFQDRLSKINIEI